MLKVRTLLLALLLHTTFFELTAQTKEEVKDILYAVSIRKQVGRSPISLTAYSEFTLHYNPGALAYNYSNAQISYSPLKWMSGSIGVGYYEEDGPQRVLGQISMVQTIDKTSVRLWFRQMYTHNYDPDTGVHSNQIRLRANAMYKIQGSKVSPIVASEVYFRNCWKRTSLYAGCNVRLSEKISTNVYYMASFLEKKNMHHLVLSTSLSLNSHR